MAVSITDKFNKANNETGVYPVLATVTASRTAGDTVLTCNDLSGWPVETPVHFTTYRVKTDGTVDTTTQTDWKGIVSDNSITQMVRVAGAADAGNLANDKAEMTPSVGWANDLMNGILASHKQDGTLKDKIVNAHKVSDSFLNITTVDPGEGTPWANDDTLLVVVVEEDEVDEEEE